MRRNLSKHAMLYGVFLFSGGIFLPSLGLPAWTMLIGVFGSIPFAVYLYWVLIFRPLASRLNRKHNE